MWSKTNKKRNCELACLTPQTCLPSYLCIGWSCILKEKFPNMLLTVLQVERCQGGWWLVSLLQKVLRSSTVRCRMGKQMEWVAKSNCLDATKRAGIDRTSWPSIFHAFSLARDNENDTPCVYESYDDVWMGSRGSWLDFYGMNWLDWWAWKNEDNRWSFFVWFHYRHHLHSNWLCWEDWA